MAHKSEWAKRADPDEIKRVTELADGLVGAWINEHCSGDCPMENTSKVYVLVQTLERYAGGMAKGLKNAECSKAERLPNDYAAHLLSFMSDSLRQLRNESIASTSKVIIDLIAELERREEARKSNTDCG